MKLDWNYIGKCFLHSIFYECEEIESKELRMRFKNHYIDFLELRHVTYGIKKGKENEADKFSGEALRDFVETGYITMDLVKGVYMSKPTQKLFDEDEWPIGFKKKSR